MQQARHGAHRIDIHSPIRAVAGAIRVRFGMFPATCRQVSLCCIHHRAELGAACLSKANICSRTLRFGCSVAARSIQRIDDAVPVFCRGSDSDLIQRCLMQALARFRTCYRYLLICRRIECCSLRLRHGTFRCLEAALLQVRARNCNQLIKQPLLCFAPQPINFALLRGPLRKALRLLRMYLSILPGSPLQ